MKSYFDGGNQADSTQYDILTVAAFAGGDTHWTRFNKEWESVRRKHNAKYAHAKDAVSLKKEFSENLGWTAEKVDAVYNDWVGVIEKHVAIPDKRLGLLPITVSVVLKDFVRVHAVMPALEVAPLHCAIQCCEFCFQFGEKVIKADKYEFYFDRNEEFFGHVTDRWKSKKVGRTKPIWKKVISCTEADSRYVAGLQAADALAWSFNRCHRDGNFCRDWQARLLMLFREKQILVLLGHKR